MALNVKSNKNILFNVIPKLLDRGRLNKSLLQQTDGQGLSSVAFLRLELRKNVSCRLEEADFFSRKRRSTDEKVIAVSGLSLFQPI